MILHDNKFDCINSQINLIMNTKNANSSATKKDDSDKIAANSKSTANKSGDNGKTAIKKSPAKK